MSTDKYTGIQIGEGFELVPADHLYALFAPYGMTKKGFTYWLRALNVPYIEMPNRTKLVNFFVFKAAVWSISSFGERDFVVPGHEYIEDQMVPTNYSTRINTEEVKENWARVLGELLMSRKMLTSLDGPGTKQILNRAIDIIVNRTGAVIDKMERRAAREGQKYLDAETQHAT